MNCRESGSTDVKTFFFWSSPVFIGSNSSSAGMETFFWSSPVFSEKNSSSKDVKALWGQFGPTLSEKGVCVKKVEDP